MNNVNNINKHTATEFLSLLSWEQWEDVYLTSV
jgi:hypothetical protein